MFCTIEDVKSRYPEDLLIQIASESDSLDDSALANITQAIQDASEEIKAYSSKYDFETDTPAIIVKLCVEISINSLLRRIENDDERHQTRQNWINNILKMLQRAEFEFNTTESPSVIAIVSNEPRGW